MRTVGRTDEAMSDGVAAETLRDEALVRTSAFRTALIPLEKSEADTALRGPLLEASRSLHGCFAEHRVEALTPYSEALARMTRLWEAQGGPVDSLAAAVGIIEQALDGFLEPVSAERMSPLYDALRRACPSPWQAHLDSDSATFEARLRAAPEAAPSTDAEAAAPERPEQAFQRELRAAFTAEADEGFAVCEELLVQLEHRPDDRDVLDALFRKFHTLKGAAAAVDLPEAAAQLHGGESLLQTVREATAVVDGVALVDFLLRLTDSVRGVIDRGCGRTESPYPVIADVGPEIAALIRTGASAAPAATPGGGPVGSRDAPMLASDATAADATSPDAAAIDTQLRTLTELRARLERGEGGGEIREVIDALDRQARQFRDLATDLKAQVSNLAAVALEGIFRRLQRPVRDAARREGKLVTMEVTGGEIRVDHAITERVYAPLLHLVRNAVSHGIETPDVRERRGKSRTGALRVRAELREGDLVLMVEDDGAGLDIAAIRAKAVSLGLIDPQHVPTRAELIPLIFQAGFSTHADVTELAGRGVGMDVVAREIEALDGVIDVESRDGSGTRIRLSIPLNTGDASTVRIVPGGAARTESGAPRRRSG